MSEDVPPRRRGSDLPVNNIELILYQLSEIKAEVREGFQKMEARFDRVEDRLGALERFRERVEERDRAEAQSGSNLNARWVPILLFVGTAMVTVILFLIQQN